MYTNLLRSDVEVVYTDVHLVLFLESLAEMVYSGLELSVIAQEILDVGLALDDGALDLLLNLTRQPQNILQELGLDMKYTMFSYSKSIYLFFFKMAASRPYWIASNLCNTVESSLKVIPQDLSFTQTVCDLWLLVKSGHANLLDPTDDLRIKTRVNYEVLPVGN